ncbi:MAG: phosphatidate cytidylyltransferase [bacterium]|jgi:phosphatidate cytidylyltransferase|nr:phosphatidate cytidylyltransferase [bacterium]
MATSDLKTRVLTSLVGIPLLLLVFWQGGLPLTVLVLAICLFSFYEMHRLYRSKGVGHSIWLVLPYVVCLPIGASRLFDGRADFLHFWGGLTFVWLLLLLLRELFSRREQILSSIGAAVLIGMISTLPFASLIALDQALPEERRRALMLAFLLCTWATDTFAYFGGRWLGRHKLFERASPKKTVEGFLAGLIGAVAVGGAVGGLAGPGLLAQGLGIGLLLGVLGPAGDLLESRLKRDAGVKDSARFLPGHGGVLDRFDSWIFCAPAGYLLAWLGWLA